MMRISIRLLMSTGQGFPDDSPIAQLLIES